MIIIVGDAQDGHDWFVETATFPSAAVKVMGGKEALELACTLIYVMFTESAAVVMANRDQ